MDSQAPAKFSLSSSSRYFIAGFGIILVFIAVLYSMGRIPICKCGYVKLWHGVVWSSENSQHIFDWYSFSHIIHGFIFYWLLSLVGSKWTIGLRFILSILIECSWEFLENTAFIIDRYRSVTMSLDYNGDSIINSVGDVVSAIFGFALAASLSPRLILIVAVAMEVLVGFLIRDNLTLNIIMLIHPFEAIKAWQMGA